MQGILYVYSLVNSFRTENAQMTTPQIHRWGITFLEFGLFWRKHFFFVSLWDILYIILNLEMVSVENIFSGSRNNNYFVPKLKLFGALTGYSAGFPLQPHHFSTLVRDENVINKLTHLSRISLNKEIRRTWMPVTQVNTLGMSWHRTYRVTGQFTKTVFLH